MSRVSDIYWAMSGGHDPQSLNAIALGSNRTRGLVTLATPSRVLGTYLIGAPGTGKSTLMTAMATQDIRAGHGICVIDPHGGVVEQLLRLIPKERERDVVLLDAADTAFPYSHNMFACPDLFDQLARNRTVAGVMHVLEKLWGPGGIKVEGWGAHMEDLLRMCTWTLMYARLTLLEMLPLLTDDRFRARVVAQCKNPTVRLFWEKDYPQKGPDQQRYRSSTINKVRSFLADETVRNIVTQREKTVDFRRFMDEGKIVLIPLAAGVIGTEAATLLGSLMVAELLTAALSRPTDQELRPFMLYADEFQHMATADFSQLMAEARKYAVATTVAHQFRAQLSREVAAAVLMVANLLVFRVSPSDAEELAPAYDNRPPPGETEYKAQMIRRPSGSYQQVKVHELYYRATYGEGDEGNIMFDAVEGQRRTFADMLGERANELKRLPRFTARARVMDGRRFYEGRIAPYMADTPDYEVANPDLIRNYSRAVYARDKYQVEKDINQRFATYSEQQGKKDDGQSSSGGPTGRKKQP